MGNYKMRCPQGPNERYAPDAEIFCFSHFHTVLACAQYDCSIINKILCKSTPISQRSPLSWCPSGTRTPASLQLVPASQQLRQKSQQNTSKGSENQFCMFNDVFFNQKFRKTSSVSIFLTSKQKNVKKLENFFFRFFSIFFSSKGPPLVN